MGRSKQGPPGDAIGPAKDSVLTPDIFPDTSNAASLTAQQLRWRYGLALSLIALLVLVSQVLMQSLIAGQQDDSRVVNIAGRQRMLSQKITKLSYHIASATSPQAAVLFRQELSEALGLWQRSHSGLLWGDAASGLPGHNSAAVERLLREIQPQHDAIAAAALSILSSAGDIERSRSLQRISEHETVYLTRMNDIVFQYEREANARVGLVKWLEIGLMGIMLLVLVFEAAYIFAPATRRIQRDMQALANHEKDLATLFAVSPSAMLLVDRKHLTVLHANGKAMDLMRIPFEEVPNPNLLPYLDSDHEATQQFLDKLALGVNQNECEVKIVDAHGTTIETLVSVRTLHYGGQAIFVLSITNISELKVAQQSLEHYATFDEMTGLLNRRTGLVMLAKSMARVERDGGQLTVCFVDLDGLKTANDVYGHAEGDWLLRATAKTLSGVIRASDAAIRFGGDEFVLLLHDCSQEEAARLLARAQSSLIETGAAQGKPFPISFSSGITRYTADHCLTPDALMAQADSLMYHAKQKKMRQRHPAPTPHPVSTV